MSTKKDYDVIGAEVHRQALENITKEMAITLVRTSGSPIVQEAKDFSTALFDAKGEHVGFSGFVSFHIASSLIGVETIIASQSDFGPGDIFICNDPHTSGAVHQGDVGIVMPMFYEDELVGWGFSNEHVLDVGGVSISGMAPDARDCYAEALRFPGTRIGRGGQLDPEWEEFIANSVRVPAPVINDIRSMIAANNVGQQKLVQAIDSFGRDRHEEYMEINKALSEEALRSRIEELPDGVYEAEDWNEYDGHGSSDLFHIRGQLIVSGDEMEFRFSSEHEQTDAFINGCRPAVWGQVMTALLVTFAYDIPVNAGIWRPISIDMGEPGTVVNAVPPAPVTNSHMEVGMRVCKASTQLLSEACALSESHELRARVAGQAHNGFPDAALFGLNQHGQPHVIFFMDPPTGIGGGAQTVHDGQDAYGCQCMLGCGMPDVEVHETANPVLFLWRRIEPNTGGPGQHRGGQAMNQAFALWGTREMGGPGFNAVAEVPPRGFGGGLPGSGGIYYSVSDAEVSEVFASGELVTPESIQGKRVDYANKTGHLVLREGDVFVTIGGGGGGLGDPLFREPARVVADIDAGYLTAEHVRAVYGVALDGDAALDLAATEELRVQMRTDRLDGKEPATATPPEIAGVVLAMQRGKDQDPSCVCLCCGSHLGTGDWRESVAVREREISEAFATFGMRVRPREDQRIVLREYFCPNCATELSADVAIEGLPHLCTVHIGMTEAPDPAAIAATG